MADDDFLWDMFGDKADDRGPKQATRVLAGMKVHGSHMQELNLGGQMMKVPTIAYVEQLEAQVKQLRTELREMHNGVNRLIRQFNSTVDDINRMRNELQAELNNKIDMRSR